MVNMKVALVLSFFIAGLGIVYRGNPTLGVGLILLWLILCLVVLYSEGVVSLVVCAFALIVWIYSFLETFFISVHN